MNKQPVNINIDIFEDLFDSNFTTIKASQKVLGDFKVRRYNNITDLKKATVNTNLKLQKLPYELDIFIEKLTASLFETVDHLKQDLKTGSDLTISKEHEKLLNLANDFNDLSTSIFDDQNNNVNEYGEENKTNVKYLKQLNTVRENLEISIATLKDFNKLINNSDLKQIISVSSMENELNTVLSTEYKEKTVNVAKLAQYKDILKQFESFYVAFVNTLSHMNSNETEQQLEQLVIS